MKLVKPEQTLQNSPLGRLCGAGWSLRRPNQRCSGNRTATVPTISRIASLSTQRAIAAPMPTPSTPPARMVGRSEEHTSELQSLMRISYAVFCLNKQKHKTQPQKKQNYHLP